MPVHRHEKIAKELKREISQLLLYELKDPRVPFLTITKVEPSSDLKYAKVFFSVMGDEKVRKEAFATLKRARAFIQSTVGRRMRIRYTPELSFHFDESIEGAVRICKLIDEVNKPRETTVEPPSPDAEEE